MQGLRILMCTYLCNPSERRDAFRQPSAYTDACYLCNKLCERDWSSYISAPSLYVKSAWDSTVILSWPSSLFSRETRSNAQILPIYGVFYSPLQSFMGECKHIAVRTLIDISSLIGRGKNVPRDTCKDWIRWCNMQVPISQQPKWTTVHNTEGLYIFLMLPFVTSIWMYFKRRSGRTR